MRTCTCTCCHLPPPTPTPQQPPAHSHSRSRGAQPPAHSLSNGSTQPPAHSHSNGATNLSEEPHQNSPTLYFMYQHPPCAVHPSPWPTPPTFMSPLLPRYAASSCLYDGKLGQGGSPHTQSPHTHVPSSTSPPTHAYFPSSSCPSCSGDALAQTVCEQLRLHTGFVAAVVLGRWV